MSARVCVTAALRGRCGKEAPLLLDHVQHQVESFARRAGLRTSHEISLTLCDNAFIRRQNVRWRGVDKATDVLSFPLHNVVAGRQPPPGPIGDIVVSVPWLRRATRELKVPLLQHLDLLLVHGLLHLLGYDHQTDAQYRRMQRAERLLLTGKKL